ncbi:response regulator [Paenibacillus eucommiae]|uniref:Two-component system response regulator YesN n=1 Tax=Paenibacillus eucommiae TaxID=1355755 RepID=A0ABS4IMD6_9BACL|nr:response regulator [Paenibacillus eucommiae]MBP1988728.1 two-component system response regulator YesN [Paenibacillus eucommiae]
MYRLLIVDDLPIITDGLVELFQKQQHLQLEVYKAYSGLEALELLKRHRIDIVLSDILMPGLDGIELLREIRSHWHACKVIMLTSHSDFEYVQSALSLGGLAYILKTEGDDKIILAVEKAIQMLHEEHDARKLIEKAKVHMKLAIPSLQREYLWSILQGKKVDSELLTEHFVNIQLPLHTDFPLLLLICRVDDWKEITKAPDKALLIYAVQNIVEEFLNEHAHLISLVYESSKIVWIIQPKSQEDGDWDKTFHYVNGMLESIQRTCRHILKLFVSFALSSHEVTWTELADRFHALKFLLVRGLGGRKETLLTEQNIPMAASHSSYSGLVSEQKPRNFQLQNKMPLLLHGLENGSEEEYYRLYEELSPIFTEESIPRLQKIELYHALSYVFLTLINKYKLEKVLKEQIDLNQLIVFDEQVLWETWHRYFLHLAVFIFQWYKNEQEESTHEIVIKVHEYIETHISRDISLNQLADQVHLNPSYLSRLYKQITGNGLSEYLMEFRDRRAKELLKESHLKVHEIAATLGYNSSHAFIRFFKKQNRMTPQEYREQWGF